MSPLSRIIALLAGSTLLAFVLVGGYLTHSMRTSAIRQWAESRAVSATQLAAWLDSNLLEAQDHLVVAAKLKAFRRPPDPALIDLQLNGIAKGTDADRRAYLDWLLSEEGHGFDVLFVLLPNGDHYLSHPFSVQESIEPYNLSHRPYFRKAKNTRKPVISDTILGADGQPAVVIDVPVLDENGEITSHLGGVFHLSSVTHLVENPRFRENHETLFLLDGSGKLIAQMGATTEEAQKISAKPFVQQFVSENAQTSSMGDYKGPLKTAPFQNKRGTCNTVLVGLKSGWTLGVSSELKPTIAQFAPGIRRTALLAAILMSLISGIGILLVRRIGLRWEAIDREQTQKALAKGEAMYRELVQSANSIILRMDNTGIITFMNPYGLELFGYTERELVGHHVVGTIVPEKDSDGGDLTEVLKSICASPENFITNKNENMRKNGDRLWISWTNKGLRSADGNIREILCVGNDQTAHRKSEKERKRLMQAIEQVVETVIITDRCGDIQYANPAFERLTGYTRDEVIGKNPHVLKSGKHDIAFYEKMWNTITGGKTWTGRITNKKKDGTLFTEDAIISPILDVSGHTVSYVAVKRDITREIDLEDQLRQAQKMESIGRLAGGVAHDFNNMLAVILGHSEIALGRNGDSEGLKKDLEQIKNAAERSAHLTRQLLAFARRQTVVLQVLDLNETISNMINMLRRLIGERIELTWTPDPKLWHLKIDPSQIDQILANLCVNASDAITGTGKIAIETANKSFDDAYCAEHPGSLPGEYVQITLSDNGDGMDDETLTHLYEPFFTTKSEGKGTGLGLSTVYGIVKQNNGFIYVYSESGRGTTFHIYLPRYRVRSDTLRKTETRLPTPPPGNETILLVEDEPGILRMGTVVLESLGYTVLPADLPSEAIRLAEKHHAEIQLLMTDVVMPEMNGKDLATHILNLCPQSKRLFSSGYTADIIADNGVVEEGIEFIQKPYTKEELASKVREVLEKSDE